MLVIGSVCHFLWCKCSTMAAQATDTSQSWEEMPTVKGSCRTAPGLCCVTVRKSGEAGL